MLASTGGGAPPSTCPLGATHASVPFDSLHTKPVGQPEFEQSPAWHWPSAPQFDPAGHWLGELQYPADPSAGGGVRYVLETHSPLLLHAYPFAQSLSVLHCQPTQLSEYELSGQL
jgi:hypothetical protein